MPTAYAPAFWPLSFLSEGHTGVSLFLVLSGFLFQNLSDGKSISYLGFIRNRLLRVFPLFAIWMLIYCIVNSSNPVHLFGSIFLALFTLTNNLVVPGVGWTVMVEMQFYLIFPLMLLLFRRYGYKFFLCIFTAVLLARCTVWMRGGEIQQFAYFTLFGRIDQFMFGMMGYEAYKRFKDRQGHRSSWLLIIVISAWTCVWHLFNTYGGAAGTPKSGIWVILTTTEGLFYASIIALYLNAQFRIPAIIGRALAYLGSLSYSIYLNHLLILVTIFGYTSKQGYTQNSFWAGFAVTTFLYIPVVLLVSYVTYNLIERPFMAMRKIYVREAR
jgi:peptidoglycan/LPS O-acetylase OafA/YrhL